MANQQVTHDVTAQTAHLLYIGLQYSIHLTAVPHHHPELLSPSLGLSH